MKLSVGNVPRHHRYGNLVNKSLGHIAHTLVVPGFIFDNNNKPVSMANFMEIQQFCNGLYIIPSFLVYNAKIVEVKLQWEEKCEDGSSKLQVLMGLHNCVKI